MASKADRWIGHILQAPAELSRPFPRARERARQRVLADRHCKFNLFRPETRVKSFPCIISLHVCRVYPCSIEACQV